MTGKLVLVGMLKSAVKLSVQGTLDQSPMLLQSISIERIECAGYFISLDAALAALKQHVGKIGEEQKV